VNVSLAINYALGGSDPAGFHALNLGVHLLAGLVLFGVLRRTLAAPRLSEWFGPSAGGVAFACALLWLIHPLQTEVIDYVTQRTESMAGLSYLLTLYASIRVMSSDPQRSGRWEAAAIGACALGMATKESMVTAPVMVLAYDRVFRAGGLMSALRARSRLYAGLSLTWIVLAALVASGPRSRSAGLSSGVSPWMYLLNQPEMIVTYLRLAVWPTGQVLDYGMPRALALTDALPYGVPVLLLLAASVAAWKWRPELAFLGLWFFVALAPSSSIVPIATEVGAERRMYLPLAAIVVAVVAGGYRLLSVVSRRYAHPRWQAAAGSFCVLAVYGVLAALTVERNGEYRSTAAIWQTVIDRHPHGRAHYSLALDLKEQGRRDEAMRHYRLALPDTPEAHYAVGFELEADKKYAEAIEHYREFLRLLPDDQNAPRAYVLLGRALGQVGRLDEAADAFAQVLRMWPRDLDGRAGLADVRLQQRRYDEAIAIYREVIGLDANNPAAYTNLGIALVGLDREGDAVPVFTKAVELEPDDPALRRNLGNALAAVGRLDEAFEQYTRALSLSPADARLHRDLGLVLVAQGQYVEAAAQFRRALDLDPANAETRAALALALQGRVPGVPTARP
jgi:tetratricopeptide (TPR) repeat protein